MYKRQGIHESGWLLHVVFVSVTFAKTKAIVLYLTTRFHVGRILIWLTGCDDRLN